MSDLFGNKIAAAGLTTFLGLMGLNMMGSAFFSHEKPEKPGYFVEVASADDGHSDKPVWVPPTDYGTLLAAADVDKGQTKAKACLSCHTFEQGGNTLQGPNLYDVVMRAKGGKDGFGYSSAMAEAGGVWDYEGLDKFLASPKKYISGTAMNYAGLSKENDRMNVIAYLHSLSASPAALPAPLPPEALLPPSEDGHGDAAHAEAADDHAAVEGAHDVASDDHAAADEAHATDLAAVDAPAIETPAAVEDIAIAVAGGVELTGASDGVESRLVSFIEADTAPCTEAECWYTFDRLTFTTGSAELNMERSEAQLQNIVAILGAYPTVELKLGGYTDNTGDADANMVLSQARADAVVNTLVDMGVDRARLGAEGYGTAHPVATNDTPEGRAQNRRIDVRVRQR